MKCSALARWPRSRCRWRRRAEVFVTNARVEVAGGESAYLGREPTGWKLTAVGCKPADGKPAARPLECEVES